MIRGFLAKGSPMPHGTSSSTRTWSQILIPTAFVTAWTARSPWPTPAQVEQDLLLSRVLIEISQDDYLGDELVFRGGTCLGKLHLPIARRYSEDLDFVRTTSSGIAPLTSALIA
jgi:hypothetical protein